MKCLDCNHKMIKSIDGYICPFCGTRKTILKSKTTYFPGFPGRGDPGGSWDNVVKAIEDKEDQHGG